MYDTGIFSEFCYGEWDLNTGRWDLGKNWAGKWDWYPPFRTLYLGRSKGLSSQGNNEVSLYKDYVREQTYKLRE